MRSAGEIRIWWPRCYRVSIHTARFSRRYPAQNPSLPRLSHVAPRLTVPAGSMVSTLPAESAVSVTWWCQPARIATWTFTRTDRQPAGDQSRRLTPVCSHVPYPAFRGKFLSPSQARPHEVSP